MTQIKLRRDTSANFASKNPVLGLGEPAYETDTKKLKIGDGTTAYNSLAYFTMADEFTIYREKYGAPSDSIPVVNTGNSITIKAGVSIETPNGTLINPTDITYTYDFRTDRVLFATENDYYHAYAVYYGGKEPSPVGEQIFWFNNNVWTAIAGNGTKTVFNTQKITPIAKIYQVDGTVKNIDYSSYTKASAGGGGSTDITATLPLKIVDGVISLEVDGQTIQVVDGKLTASSTAPANMVTTNTTQTITGNKTFKGPIKVTNSGYTRTLADVNTNGGIPYLYLGESTSRMYLLASNPINRMSGGGVEYPIIDTGNLGSYVDGTTITFNNNKLTASGGSSEPPANMVTTDTNQTITGLKTFAGNIVLDQRQVESGFQCLYTNDTGNIKTSTFIQPQNFSLGAGYATLNIGLSDVRMILHGSTIKDSSGNKFLVQGSITGTDNVTVTETTDGIQVAGLSNATIANLSGMTNNITKYSDIVSGTEYNTTEAGFWILQAHTEGRSYVAMDIKASNGTWIWLGSTSYSTAGADITTPAYYIAAGEVVRMRHGTTSNARALFLKAKGGVQ